MSENFLDRIYHAEGAEETRDIYDDWAASYETEISDNGYATPRRCARALAKITDDLSTPILDFGCGTGLSGVALAAAGFTVIDGVDVSSEMLRRARDKGIYRETRQIKGDSPLVAGAYPNMAAIGVIGAGAAPISVLDTIMHALPSGGRLVFSFNDHTLQDPVHEARICEWTDTGAARLIHRKRGEHLPRLGIKSNVYILEKA